MAAPCPPPVPAPPWWVLAGLVLLCLVPRVYAAVEQDILCFDTVSYLQSARCLERGDATGAFKWMGINLYPLILTWLHRLPLDWFVAGKVFSVAMATLAVLPLYGWARRQFNEPTAILSGLLYAVHPLLIWDSPLVIRDPLFWFLFCGVLYVGWRAVTEVRLGLFLIQGLLLTMAIHVRSEGWLLLVPWLSWLTFRLPHVAGRRIRLGAGGAVSLAVIPLTIVLLNGLFFAGVAHWRLGDKRHVTQLVEWVDSLASAKGEGELGQASDPAAVAARAANSTGVYARKYGVRLVKAFGYLHGALVLLGLWVWRREVRRPAQLALALTVALSFAAIWIRCRQGIFDQRYFFPALLLALPVAAQGLAAVAAKLAGWAAGSRSDWATRWPRALGGLVLVLVVLCLVQAWWNPRPLPYAQADLGKWICRTLGPHRLIAGSLNEMRLIEYYSQGRVIQAPRFEQFRPEPVLKAIAKRAPDVVLLWNDWRNPAGLATYEKILARQKQLGYEQVDPAALPPRSRQIVVLRRIPPEGG